MNLVDNIEKHFKEHSDYDELTKIRYIYLYICKVFSYDTRFYSRDSKIKKDIYNKKVDVTNVEDFELVCFSIACVLDELLKHFGFESKIEKNDDKEFPHAYVIANCMNNNMPYRIKLDPTINHDITRVKLDSPTLSFEDLDNHHDFIDSVLFSDSKIKESQKPINHDEYYDTLSIKELNDVITRSAKNRGLTPQELFFEKLEYLKCLINVRKGLQKFDDIDYYLSYIIRNLEMNDNPMNPYLRPAILYKGKDFEDVICLVHVKYLQYPEQLLLLKKENNKFVIGETTKEEAKELLQEYYSPDCQYYFETLINNLPDTTSSKTK